MNRKVLLLDVGGVLLSNGWDFNLRKKAADAFGLDFTHMQNLHDMVFEDYERGALTLDDYIAHVVFCKPRNFTISDFKAFMFAQAAANFSLMQALEAFKAEYGIKIALLSNEGKELASDRFQKFPFFCRYVDSYIVSGFVRLRKPDLRMYRLALGVVQVNPNDILFIDDRPKNLPPAQFLGMHTLQHVDNDITMSFLEKWLQRV